MSQVIAEKLMLNAEESFLDSWTQNKFNIQVPNRGEKGVRVDWILIRSLRIRFTYTLINSAKGLLLLLLTSGGVSIEKVF